ncbi:O-linked N-acetylglucosamine transferase, SPINDLY family protein [Pannus brasiliensis CCIBt3594]|uniref:O-linked N-acetylglucosamine transferase, SPINDLY family protein n=1 Tax=Pannus brasiliensis CCIBt3594 TaxID=1427578 RepID=A0AAW9QS65_9CHRO
MPWNVEVNRWIESGEYDRAVRFYEELIETEPEEIRHYWYLGLAYLLVGREEEARTTWFFVLSGMEETELDTRTAELVAVLEEEANRQTELDTLDRVWLIRGYIREIVPDYLDNLLRLILVEARLDRFHPDRLQEWDIIDLVATREIDPRLLEQGLEMAIGYPHTHSIEFARAGLSHFPEPPECLARILIKTKQIAYQRKLPHFSSDLLEVFREQYPDDLQIAVNLFWFYISTPNFDKSYRLARQLYEQSTSLDLQLLSKSLLFNGMLRGSRWNEIPAVCQEYKALVERWVREQPESIHPLVRDNLLTVMNPISYYEDNPEANRPLLERIGTYFVTKYRESIARSEIAYSRPKERASQKIKLGYIAQTFRRHPVGLLSRWVMQYHDRERFHLTFYLIDQPVDEITRQWFFGPEDTTRLFPGDPLAIARQIREDEIDILIDLDSGTTVSVSRVMALKPAPVQVNWLGFDSSGLPTIDYLLADPYVLPEKAQDYYFEKIWRLPHAFVAVDGFEVAVPTLRREDLGITAEAVIYLSSQTALKRNPPMIQLQMRILKAVPNSYFLIQGISNEMALRELLLSIAEKEGVSGERIKMMPLYQPTELYRANLTIADVILDTYPFNGGTTTLEALWMGIPVVTKVGRQWSSRNGYTLLTNAGITEGIAWNDAEYVEWGIRLGTDARLREEVRWKLRRSRRTSPLWNTRQFTKDLEEAYRQMREIYRESAE